MEYQEDPWLEVPASFKKKLLLAARDFRKAPTPSEALLWQKLRGRQLGVKFRRQQPIGPFIVDFYCPTQRLVIEVDGSIHKQQAEVDRSRQEMLELLGLRVLRLPAELVEEDITAVLELISKALEDTPHPNPARKICALPSRGEGLKSLFPVTAPPAIAAATLAGDEGPLQAQEPPGIPQVGSPEPNPAAPLAPCGRGAGGEGFLSIGYGRRTIAHFITLLHQHQIACLIDVRSRPFSRFNPDFSRKRLESHLFEAGIEYAFMGDTLGGMPDDATCYTPEGKIDYAFVRERAFFQEGLERLRRVQEQGVRAVLMCAETKPEMCHRTHLVGAALAEEGIEILHLDENDRLLTQAEVLARLE